MRTRDLIITITAATLAAGCAPRIYRPPRLGAEYRFDEGLPPKKPKQELFSPDMKREMEASGQAPQSVNIAGPATPAAKRDSTHRAVPAAADTARAGTPIPADTLTTRDAPASPASPDSSRNARP